MDTTVDWPELLKHPDRTDHMVQLYRDSEFLVEAVAQYLGAGLRLGEAALVIATPEHRERFKRALARQHLYPTAALKLLDAEQTLALVMVDGMPERRAFQHVIGGALAELRRQYPTVRGYGELVDVLWRRGERAAALRLEELWDDMLRAQPCALLCAYSIDTLRGDAYGGALEAVCRMHTHLIPTRDYLRFNEAVREAAKAVLDQPLAQMLLNLAANHRPHTEMPLGQAALLWLKQNMPRTADKVLDSVRARLA